MSNSRALLVEIAILATVGAACTSDTDLGRTGAGGAPSGTGGSTASGGAIGSGAIPGGRGGASTGGATSSGAGGSQAGGSADARDGGVADVPSATDGIVECAPGYGAGSVRPLGDGCNTCTCQASGLFVCTTAQCSAPDAAGDAKCTGGACPADAAVLDVPSGACSDLTTQAACEARSTCHPVFFDPGDCGCATPGCCARFSACADGGKATCTMPSTLACLIATPSCEKPYVLSYTKVCYEGCVLQSECNEAVFSDASVGGETEGGAARDTGASCPAAEPQVGQTCNASGPLCEYGSGVCCGHGYTCEGGAWQKLMVPCPCPAPAADAGSCSSTFTGALTKDCLIDADCTLAKHNDCCGNVVMGIRTGTTAGFSSAEQAFQTCECTNTTGCYHVDMAEDGSQAGTVGASIVARCQSNRCTSTVVTASSCTTDSDCPGQICVAYVTHTGATASTKRECRNNPCNNTTASCGCASGLCTTAGFPLCSVTSAQLTCDDGRQ